METRLVYQSVIIKSVSADTRSKSLMVESLQVQDEYQELTSDTLLTHFMLSVPATATASFSTHLVSLNWLLRFEFVTMAVSASTGWLGGTSKHIDRLIWTLPLLVQTP